jgi:hypothetical protein
MSNQYCTRCFKSSPINHFGENGKFKTCTTCREYNRAYGRKYYKDRTPLERNPKLKEYYAEYYKNKKEELKEASRKNWRRKKEQIKLLMEKPLELKEKVDEKPPSSPLSAHLINLFTN